MGYYNEFNNILERHLVKAFAQVETTLNYVRNKNKIGIIVIFDYINFPTMINSYLKSKYPEHVIRNISNRMIRSEFKRKHRPIIVELKK